jgi:3-dehydroquinate synthase
VLNKILNFEVISSLRKYQISLGSEILVELPDIIRNEVSGKKVFLVSDENILSFHKPRLQEIFENTDLNLKIFHLPPGEKTKSNDYVQNIYSWLIENKCDRHSCIIAFGGGVIGDCVGFVAATYLRGIKLIQIPTTLLSMVDSSIGGKVGINHKLGKNLIGAFYPPHKVIQDISILNTLNEREFRSGLGECVKHSLISSIELFNWMKENSIKILNLDQKIILELVKFNLKIKADIVQKDEQENNIRAYLNFGHTFGHALEKEFGYSNNLLHGEGVSLGMIAALKLSENIFSLDKSILEKTLEMLKVFSLPTKLKLPPFSDILESMTRDKKNKSGEITFVLLSSIGSPVISTIVDHSLLEDAYNFISI